MPKSLIVCGDWSGSVWILDAKEDWDNSKKNYWTWTPDKAPADYKKYFQAVVDIKRIKGGKELLYCGAECVARIKLKDKKVQLPFIHVGINGVHSAELLPDGNIATVSARNPKTEGRIRIYCESTATSDVLGKPVVDEELYNGHGVVWDKKRESLWGLGGRELVRFKYSGPKAKPSLKKEVGYKLYPDEGGHDLFPTGDDRFLFVTVGASVWLFDPAKETWKRHPDKVLGDLDDVKGISQRGAKGETIYVYPNKPYPLEWCTDTVTWAGSQTTKKKSGANFYKVRWWYPNTFSYGPLRSKVRRDRSRDSSN